MGALLKFLVYVRPSAVVFFLVISIAIGLNSYIEIPEEELPDVTVPFVHISTQYSGASVEITENLVAKPIERYVSSVAGVKSVQSMSYRGHVNTLIGFEDHVDIKEALQNVQRKLEEAKSELPKNVDSGESTIPILKEINITDSPVITIFVTGYIQESQLQIYAKLLQDKLQSSSKILDVQMVGEKEERMEFIVDPMHIQYYDIGLPDVQQILAMKNLPVSSGRIENKIGGINTNVVGQYETEKQVLSDPIIVNGQSMLSLKDIVDYKRSFKPLTVIGVLNGKKGISLRVIKSRDTSVIEAIDDVKSIVNHAKKFLPKGVEFIYTSDQSSYIKTKLDSLRNNVLFASIIVFSLLVMFLGAKIASFVALNIPITLLWTIMTLYFLGFTLNVVVLFGLILSLGMIVDSSIVIAEFANNLMRQGFSKKSSYIKSVTIMFLPILSSILTTILVCLPLLFWPGTIGKVMVNIPSAVIIALSTSAIISFFILPVVASLGGKQEKSMDLQANFDDSLHQIDYEHTAVYEKYLSLLNKIMDRPKAAILGVVFVLVSIFTLYANFNYGTQFFPSIELNRITVTVKAKGNFSVQDIKKFAFEVEDIIEENFSQYIQNTYNRYGLLNKDNFEVAMIELELTEFNDRDLSTRELVYNMRNKLRELKGFNIEVRSDSVGPVHDKPIKLILTSISEKDLYKDVEKIYDFMSNNSGFIEVEKSNSTGNLQLKINVNRELAALYGANVLDISKYISLITTQGNTVGEYVASTLSEPIDIVIAFPKKYRNIKFLEKLTIKTNRGWVPVAYFIDYELNSEVKSLNRYNGDRSVIIKSDVAQGKLVNNQVYALKEFIKNSDLSENVFIEFKGDEEEQGETLSFLMKSYIVALLLVIFILILQFNSYIKAFIILTSVMFSIAGAFLLLLILGRTFIISMCGLGLVSLIGIVVNNNIILIDSVNYFVQKGLDKRKAIIQACLSRLRPILLTTSTTILGIIPMLIGISIDFISLSWSIGAPGAQWFTHLTTIIVGGLTFSALFTLFFTPVLLSFYYKFYDE